MFASFFAICILLSTFALFLSFLRFVKKKITLLSTNQNREIFSCVLFNLLTSAFYFFQKYGKLQSKKTAWWGYSEQKNPKHNL